MPPTTLHHGAVRWEIERRTNGEIAWLVFAIDNSTARRKIASGTSTSDRNAVRDVATVVIEYISTQRG